MVGPASKDSVGLGESLLESVLGGLSTAVAFLITAALLILFGLFLVWIVRACRGHGRVRRPKLGVISSEGTPLAGIGPLVVGSEIALLTRAAFAHGVFAAAPTVLARRTVNPLVSRATSLEDFVSAFGATEETKLVSAVVEVALGPPPILNAVAVKLDGGASEISIRVWAEHAGLPIASRCKQASLADCERALADLVFLVLRDVLLPLRSSRGEMSSSPRLSTSSRESYRLASEAEALISDFHKTGERDLLATAQAKAEQAVTAANGNYTFASYLVAVLHELRGDQNAAIVALTTLRRDSTVTTDSDWLLEVTFNLALAQYHKYHLENLQNAEQLLVEIEASIGLWMFSRFRTTLRLSVLALRAQVDAMKLQSIDADQRLTRVGLAALARRRARRALLLGRSLGRWIGADAVASVRGTAHNARGMAFMYDSDTRRRSNAEIISKLEKTRFGGLVARSVEQFLDFRLRWTLKRALRALSSASAFLAHDWANKCDLASVYMRLAASSAGEERLAHLGEARSLLVDVIEVLRPGYGFALYEMGRVERLAGEFDAAEDAFRRALTIPPAERDVSDRKIAAEQDRVRKRDGAYYPPETSA